MGDMVKVTAEEEIILKNLFQAMKSWDANKVIHWIEKVLGDDNDKEIKKIIDDISRTKCVSGIELAASFELIFSQKVFNKSKENIEDEQVSLEDVSEYSEISTKESKESDSSEEGELLSDKSDFEENSYTAKSWNGSQEEKEMETSRGDWQGGKTGDLNNFEDTLRARRMRFGAVSPLQRPKKYSNGNGRGRSNSRLLSHKSICGKRSHSNSPQSSRSNSGKRSRSNSPPCSDSRIRPRSISRSRSHRNSLKLTRSISRCKSHPNSMNKTRSNSRGGSGSNPCLKPRQISSEDLRQNSRPQSSSNSRKSKSRSNSRSSSHPSFDEGTASFKSPTESHENSLNESNSYSSTSSFSNTPPSLKPRRGKFTQGSPILVESHATRNLTEKIVRKKSMLKRLGKWTDDLQTRWNSWRSEENKLKLSYTRKKNLFGKRPDFHPSYETERLAFFEKLAAETWEPTTKSLEQDPFYTKKWEIFWDKWLYDLLQFEMGQKLEELQRKHGIDLESLKAI